jgi:hypothetical protein
MFAKYKLKKRLTYHLRASIYSYNLNVWRRAFVIQLRPSS